MLGLACPSWRLTKTTSSLRAIRSEANVCRSECRVSWRVQFGALEGLAEAFADVAVVEAAAERVGEHEVVCCLVAAGEPVLAHAWRAARRGLPRAVLPRFEPGVLAAARELPVDADQSGLVVDVGPGEAEGKKRASWLLNGGEPRSSRASCRKGHANERVKRTSPASPPTCLGSRRVGLCRRAAHRRCPDADRAPCRSM